MSSSRLCRAVFSGLLLLCGARSGAGETWLTNLDEAERLAAKEDKELFIVFTGTSWCGPCVDFEKDVLSWPGFLHGMEPFVLVKLEYPKSDDDLPLDRRDDFIAWRERYGIRAFPTVLLTDAIGRPYAVTGNIGLRSEEYAQHLRRLRQARVLRDGALSKAMQAQGAEKARLLDVALTAVASAFDKNKTDSQGDMLVRLYRPEIDQILALDPENAAGLRDKYRGLLGDEGERDRIAAMGARFSAAMKDGGAEAALKLIDEELARAKSVGLRKTLQGYRRVYLEWGERNEEALAYATKLVEDDSYTTEEKRQIRGRIAFNLVKLGRIDEAAAVYDQLIEEVTPDRDAVWRLLRDKAQMLTVAGRLAEALGAWEVSRRDVVEGTEQWLDSEVFRCRLLGRLGRDVEAVTAFDSALKVKSLTRLDRANLLSEKAMVLGKAGRREEALACAARAEECLAQTKTDGESEEMTKFIRYKLKVARGEQKKDQ